VDLAALAAPAAKEDKPDEKAAPPSPFGDVSAPAIQAPPVEAAPAPATPSAAGADYTGAGDADMFAKSDRKKYLPLAVIGVVLLIGIIVLSAGGSPEPTRPAEKQQAAPAKKGPPRDIRSKMAKKKDKSAGEQEGSTASPGSGSKDKGAGSGDSSGSGTGEGDLVEAMKQGLEKK
jgi:hypothetical protein